MNKYLIQTIQVGSNSPVTVNFLNIKQGDFTDLVIKMSGRYNDSAGGQWSDGYIQFNNSSANLSMRLLYAVGTGALSLSSSGDINLRMCGSGATANTFSPVEIYIPNAFSNKAKSINANIVTESNTTASIAQLISGLWNSTDPINTITFGSYYSSFAEGTIISLYGIKSGSDGVTKPVATGGTVTTTGSYTVHTFTASDTFTLNKAITGIEYLVVAGGGGGASAYWGSGAGGGAGGYRSSVAGESSGGGASAEAKLSLVPGKYSVIVGAGGSTGTYYGNGYNGGNSAFGDIISIGGGSGGYTTTDRRGGSGGSGGGGGYGGTGGGGAGTAGQGYAGGDHLENSCGPGGGGAAEVGATANVGLGGRPGGSGVSSSINGTATYRAGGGGGGRYLNEGGSAGAGGNGGGGAGAQHNGTASAGTANTGGGGGGAGTDSGGTSIGGAGGSGIVIIRYLTPA